MKLILWGFEKYTFHSVTESIGYLDEDIQHLIRKISSWEYGAVSWRISEQ
jgi:hypothetical protein